MTPCTCHPGTTCTSAASCAAARLVEFGEHVKTTTAMPELPEPELGYIETDKSNQPAFSARQMRAAMQAQPEEVSDAQIAAGMRELFAGPKPWPSWEVTLKRVYQAMFALRPQAVPMTEDAARLDWMASRSAHIGWDRDGDFCRVWAIEDEEIGQAPITGWHDSARDAIDAARTTHKD